MSARLPAPSPLRSGLTSKVALAPKVKVTPSPWKSSSDWSPARFSTVTTCTVTVPAAPSTALTSPMKRAIEVAGLVSAGGAGSSVVGRPHEPSAHGSLSQVPMTSHPVASPEVSSSPPLLASPTIWTREARMVGRAVPSAPRAQHGLAAPSAHELDGVAGQGLLGEAVVLRIGPRTANDAVLARRTLGVRQRRVECLGIGAEVVPGAVDPLRGC